MSFDVTILLAATAVLDIAVPALSGECRCVRRNRHLHRETDG